MKQKQGCTNWIQISESTLGGRSGGLCVNLGCSGRSTTLVTRYLNYVLVSRRSLVAGAVLGHIRSRGVLHGGTQHLEQWRKILHLLGHR